MDRYYEVNNTLLLIDILLLRVEVFRHIIHNRTIIRPFIFYSTYFISRVVFISKYFNLYNTFSFSLILKLIICAFIEMGLLVLFVSFLNKFMLSLVFNTFIITSFYYLFVYFMILWSYKELEYYVLIEILVMLSNSIGLSCISKCSIEYMFIVIGMFKIPIYLMYYYVYLK
jgi:hypothetical protein